MINALAGTVKATGAKILLFADDILILARGKAQLTQALTAVEQWSSCHNFKVNRAKSGILKFRHKTSPQVPEGTTIMSYPVVSQFPYLGLVFTDTGSIAPSMKSSITDLGKIKSKVRYLAGLIPDLASKAMVVSAFYVSKARYCLALAATTSSLAMEL